MGILESLAKRLGLEKSEEIELDEVLASLEMEEAEVEVPQAKMYVKPITLQSDSDLEEAIKEVETGNIVLLNIAPMLSRNIVRLKHLMERMKDVVRHVDGDIARLTEEWVIVTPSEVKMIKRRR